MRELLLGMLRRVLPADWASDIVRDLEEAHGRREREVGRFRADLWLSAQAFEFAGRFGLERVGDLFGPSAGAGFLGAAARDVRHALRSLGRSPLFLTAVALTLAAGLGANAAVFAVVRNLLLEPLPYPSPEELVVLQPNPWSPADVTVGLRRAGTGLQTVEAFYPRRFVVSGEEEPWAVEGAVVSPGFLRTLGAETALGRGFTEDDGRAGARVAILGHDVWQRRYGSSPHVLGRTIRLDGVPHAIVGVTEADFRQLTPGSGEPELWTAGVLDRLGAGMLHAESPPWAIPVARLDPRAPPERAGAALQDAIARHLEENPEVVETTRWDVRWTPLRDHLQEGIRHPLLLLQGAAAILLLLACVNVANLYLIRLLSRRQEVAVRATMGASRGRLLRHLLTESVVLGIVGGLAALAVMHLSLNFILAVAPPELTRLEGTSIDAPVSLIVMGVSVGVGALFGIAPALIVTAGPPGRILKERGRTSTASRGRHLVGQALVVGQVTLTLVLVVGAGLLFRSFHSLSGQEPGFRTEDVLVLPMLASVRRYASVPDLGRYQSRLVARLSAVPGVESVGLANHVPIDRRRATRLYVVEGEDAPRQAQYGVVSAGYFRTLEIPLVAGRGFRERDDRDAPRVAVVDEAMGRAAWPGRDPIGKRFRLHDEGGWIRVVGVTASIRGSGLGHDPEPGFHLPITQRPDLPIDLAVGREMVLMVRTRSGLPGMGDALRGAVWEIDPDQPVPEVTPMEGVLARTTSPQRFRAVLLGAFAFVALLLAVTGIYGVVGYQLQERIHEIGIRRALGARDRHTVGRVLLWGLRLAAVGVAFGLVGVVWAGRFLEGLLFAVTPADGATLAGGVALVLAATVGACLIPAYRATRVDHIMSIRSQ